VVVVTGASTGIGRACVLHLDALGFEVFAGVRKEADGVDLRQSGSPRLVPVILDVTADETIRAAARLVSEQVGDAGIAGLVNNAGIALAGPLEFISLERLRRQLEVNLVGQLATTQAFLPALRRGGGRIVFTSSIHGRVALPLVGPYGASKHALEGMADSLRRELRPWGIKVSLLEPGTVATPIWAKGLADADEMFAALPREGVALYGGVLNTLREAISSMGSAGVAPEAVARVIEHALTARKPRTRYLIGREARIQAMLHRLLPDRTLDALIARRIKASEAPAGPIHA